MNATNEYFKANNVYSKNVINNKKYTRVTMQNKNDIYIYISIHGPCIIKLWE